MGLRKEARSSPEYRENMKIHEMASAVLKGELEKKEEQIKRTGNAHYTYNRDEPESERLSKLAAKEYNAGQYFSKHEMSRLAIKAYKTAESLDEMQSTVWRRIGYENQSKAKYLHRQGKLEGVKLMRGRREGKRPSLEGTAVVASVVALLASIFFLSSNITGNVIGLNQNSTNYIGIILFVIGLIGAFVYFRRKR